MRICISPLRPESIYLKKDGQRTYDRITDFNSELNEPAEKLAFSLKNSAIIRQIVNNPKNINVFIDIYQFDCVNRMGTDRYDEPDMIYGLRVVYEQPFTKHFIFVGEYRWQTAPKMHDCNIPTESFIARVVTRNLPKELAGRDGHQLYLLHKEHHGGFGNTLVDTSKYTSMSAIVKYKAAVMRRKAKR